MTLETLIRSDLWKTFEKQARKQKKQPSDLLAELLREHLEIAEDVALDEAIARSARRSKYRESDAVRIVRQYRKEKEHVVPPRKDRLAVVLDTNVIVGRFLSRGRPSANLRVYNLWSME